MHVGLDLLSVAAGLLDGPEGTPGPQRVAGARALLARLRSARVGVLAHAASVDRRLRHAGAVLEAARVVPALWFAPEHGMNAAAQDMVAVGHGRHSRSSAPLVSLYGESAAQLVPAREHLGAIDVLLVDLCDVGARYYTFVWTALLALRAAAAAGVHVVVLDRPNPIGGLACWVEGRSQRSGYTSFVGLDPVPIRHGLTVGEMLAFCAERDGLSLGPAGALSVLPVVGWDRSWLAGCWDRPFVPPSPNMPTPDTALVYPGGCLVEGTNLSEGRGQTRPFEVVGAPWLDGEGLARDLAGTGLTGFVPRPVGFVPTFHKHAGLLCGGVQIHVTDPAAFRPVATYAALVALARRQKRERFRFRTEPYELVADIPAFDLLTGSPEARLAIERDADVLEVAALVAEPDPAWPEQMRRAQELAERASW